MRRFASTAVFVAVLSATLLGCGVTPTESAHASPRGLFGSPSAAPTPPPALRSRTPKPTPRASTRPAHRPRRHSVALFHHRPTGPTQRATVTRVIDGDTIEVSVRGRLYHVRYIGMDTPEVYFGVEPMGPEASAANKRLVSGRKVLLEKDVSQTDRYGRLLRFVWLRRADGWLLVNAELLREGFAQITTYPPDVKYADTVFLRAQRRAREHNRGLWAL
jgi:micrococcal nuclease